MIVKAHPRRLQLLISTYMWRAAVRPRFRKQNVVGSHVAVRGAFVQQIQITILWAREVHAKLPTVLEDLLSGRLELILIRFVVAHLLDSQRISQRTFRRVCFHSRSSEDRGAFPRDKAAARTNQDD